MAAGGAAAPSHAGRQPLAEQALQQRACPAAAAPAAPQRGLVPGWRCTKEATSSAARLGSGESEGRASGGWSSASGKRRAMGSGQRAAGLGSTPSALPCPVPSHRITGCGATWPGW